MHSSLVRIQNAFGFFTTVAFTVAALVAVTDVFSRQTPSASLTVQNIQVVKGRAHYSSPRKEDFASIRFDLEADLSSLYTWNTKQLFIYVFASYPSLNQSEPASKAIIWDMILESPSALEPISWRDVLRLPDPTTKTSKSRAKAKAKKVASSSKAVKPGILSLKNERPKYKISDISGTLAGRGNVTLELGWNVQPWVGALTWPAPQGGRWMGMWEELKGGKSDEFAFPPIKGTVMADEKAAPKPAEAKPIL